MISSALDTAKRFFSKMFEPEKVPSDPFIVGFSILKNFRNMEYLSYRESPYEDPTFQSRSGKMTQLEATHELPVMIDRLQDFERILKSLTAAGNMTIKAPDNVIYALEDKDYDQVLFHDAKNPEMPICLVLDEIRRVIENLVVADTEFNGFSRVRSAPQAVRLDSPLLE